MPKVKQDMKAKAPAPLAVSAVTPIVAPELETTDPTPDIQALKARFDKEFFNGIVGNVTVSWSNRMTKAAGLCRYRKGVCSVTLSKPLLSLRSRKDLIETLLHELIHAYFFMTGKFKEHHGPNFKKMMNWINQKAGTNISVYHSFHDEVRQQKNHWWQCNGTCKKYVRRSKNSPPKSTEWGWAKHQETCGGTFVKIAEPEKTKAGIPTGKAIKIKPLGMSNPAVPPLPLKKDLAASKDTCPSVPAVKPINGGSIHPKVAGPKVKPPVSKPTTYPAKTKEEQEKKPKVAEVDNETGSLISVFKKMILDGDPAAKPGFKSSGPNTEIPVITLDDSEDDDELDIFEFDGFDSDQELDGDSIIRI